MIRRHSLSILIAIAAFQAAASAANISLSLNLEFNSPNDFNSGGTWTVVAKADERGIAGAVLELTNVNFDLDTGFLAPVIFYSLNDLAPNPALIEYDAAGFNVYGRIQSGQTEASAFQLNTEFSRRFYDVGVIGGATHPGENGTPAVAPGIASRQVPWGTYMDDPRLTLFGANPDLGSFTGGVAIATGAFNVDAVPGWGSAPELTGGNVWPSTTSLPAIPATVFTTVRYVVPEPSTFFLGVSSAIGLMVAAWRRGP